MGLFIVRNVRPNRTVTLHGRVLAPANTGGRTNSMALTLEQLLDAACVEQIKLGTLVLQGEPPAELLSVLSPAESPTETPEAPEPPPLVVEVAPVEPVPVPEPPSAEVSEVVESSADQHTAESLKELTVTELRKIAKGYKLKSSGTEDELIQRILDHEAGVA